ncbi:MAG: 16S rRNA (adenine(1518)-N(6)/adenine(1519)-N(6))-dimethyltransferase RsmA [Candidatus Omnitrophota bacterium]|jgi:16S rRNA (adenine1518-N6/adenine1519-N6)-dimethyltransferase
MLTKSQLKEVFENYGFRPLKRFGENYLIDANIKDKIIKEASIAKGDTILEIGPGLGALTIDLASSGARVVAVEKDKKAFRILTSIAGADHPNLELVCQDILEFDIARVFSGKKIKLIGNLPYYISSPIIEYMIDNRRFIESAIFMVQKEVAARLLAGPGTKDYSSVSCFVQYYTKPKYVHTVKRGSFHPEPEVDSAIVRFDLSTDGPSGVKDEKMLFRVIRGAFNQRRKTIINSLSREAVLDIPKDELARILDGIGIGPERRPETLGLPEFIRIANAVVR